MRSNSITAFVLTTAFAGSALAFQVGEETNLLPVVIKQAGEDLHKLEATYNASIAPFLAEQRRTEAEITMSPNRAEPHERLALAQARVKLAGAGLHLQQAAMFERVLDKMRAAFELPGGGPDLVGMRQLREELQASRDAADGGPQATTLDEELGALDRAIADGERALSTLSQQRQKTQRAFDELGTWAKKKHEEASVLLDSARVQAKVGLAWEDLRQGEAVNAQLDSILQQISKLDKAKPPQ
jgi:hypothetical protein